MFDGLIGEIRIFAGNREPEGWKFCHGQPMSIAKHGYLFNILGTRYGGDGKTSFNLPDFRGRMPVCAGKGASLTMRELGQTGGAEKVVLESNHLPPHSHSIAINTGDAKQPDASNAFLAIPVDSQGQHLMAYYLPTAQPASNELSIQPAGDNQPHNNMPPFMAFNFIIAISGEVPERPRS